MVSGNTVSGGPAQAPPRPDLTETTNALAALLEPHGDHLRLEPLEAARIFRLVTFASAHPTITDGQRLSTPEIVELLLHGISARASSADSAEKNGGARSDLAAHSPAGAPDLEMFSRPAAANQEVSTQPVGAQ